jgi:hypothetical protein
MTNTSTQYDTLQYVETIYNNSLKNSFRIITGGIGDFIAMDYYYKFSRRYNLIFLTSSGKRMRDMLHFYGYPRRYFALYYDWNTYNHPGFSNTNELINNYPQILRLKDIKYIHISDYFNPMLKIINKESKFLYYWIINSNYSEIIKEFNLPENIAFISPYTEDISINCINCKKNHNSNYICGYTRNFVIQDYMNTCFILESRGLIGVIISCEPITLPENIQNMFINLSTKTSLEQCVEILKRSKCYIGIDTCFSVIASKIFRDHRNIFIKSNNVGLYKYALNYYYPHKVLNINTHI